MLLEAPIFEKIYISILKRQSKSGQECKRKEKRGLEEKKGTRKFRNDKRQGQKEGKKKLVKNSE